MKQLLTILALLIIGSSVASAQEPVESEYLFLTWVMDNQDATWSFGFPTVFPDNTEANSFDNTQWRGLGQVVNLSLIYNWYDEVYGENTNIHYDGSNGITDQDYVDQFRGAGSFTIDSVSLFIFSRDPNAFNNSETLGSLLSVIRSDYDFTSPNYLTRGFVQDFNEMKGPGEENVLIETYTTADVLAANYTEGTGNVQGTRIRYEDGGLSFGADESAIFMYWVPADPGYTFDEIQERNTNGQPNQQNLVIAQTEYLNGHIVDAQDELDDTRTDSVDYYKALGLVLFRDGNGTDRIGDPDTDTVYSAWQNLRFLNRPGLVSYRMFVWGIVELDTSTTSVRYHFGRAADNQGLGSVQPNPAVTDARLPFSLTERANVSIEIYSVSGEKVASLVEDKRYVEGNYDVMIPVSEMENGAYVIRMSANEKAYSMKFTVAK